MSPLHIALAVTVAVLWGFASELDVGNVLLKRFPKVQTLNLMVWLSLVLPLDPLATRRGREKMSPR
ncbi:MAG: hypothetical protein ABI580_15155 [Burkholderiaceae bacterium]